MDEVALQQFRKEQADLLLDVLREVELAILDSELAGCFDAAVALEIQALATLRNWLLSWWIDNIRVFFQRQLQDDIVREEAAALRRRMNMTEDQRITEAMQYLQRLTVERVKQRRNLGKRATFLTENITWTCLLLYDTYVCMYVLFRRFICDPALPYAWRGREEYRSIRGFLCCNYWTCVVS